MNTCILSTDPVALAAIAIVYAAIVVAVHIPVYWMVWRHFKAPRLTTVVNNIAAPVRNADEAGRHAMHAMAGLSRRNT